MSKFNAGDIVYSLDGHRGTIVTHPDGPASLNGVVWDDGDITSEPDDNLTTADEVEAAALKNDEESSFNVGDIVYSILGHRGEVITSPASSSDFIRVAWDNDGLITYETSETIKTSERENVPSLRLKWVQTNETLPVAEKITIANGQTLPIILDDRLPKLKEESEEEDVVNHPKHYTAYSGIEVIDLTEQMNFNRGNAVKYIARAGLKNPDKEIEDLEKAVWYVNREIRRLKGLQ